LKLNALPERRGVLSEHLGSRAWHASAILACLLLQHEETKHAWLERCVTRRSKQNHRDGSRLTVLELGSGAVGLSGLALAALAVRQRQPPSNHSHDGAHRQSTPPRVILTDLQPDFDHKKSSSSWGVLSNLDRNVTENLPAVQEYGQSFHRGLVPSQTKGSDMETDTNNEIDKERENPLLQPPLVEVRHLDWNDYRNKNGHDVDQDIGTVDLIVGSELVYTPELGIACAATIRHLLLRTPAATPPSHDDTTSTSHYEKEHACALVVQVLDRDGFETDFLPALQNDPALHVCLEQISCDIYDQACAVVASSSSSQPSRSSSTSSHGNILGGTMDRFQYRACWIRKTTTTK
jgi:hypothetical protein